jgi:glycosyltransferase involved in cell wall biosynthesis
MSVYVRAQRKLGMNVRGLVLGSSTTQDAEGLEVLHVDSLLRNPVRGLRSRLAVWRTLRDAFHWADIVHWRYGVTSLLNDGGLILRYLGSLNKGCLIDFCGTDIRINEDAARENPYWAAMLARKEGKPDAGSRRQSLRVQRLFARCGFQCVMRRVELLQYLDPRYFPKPYVVRSPTFIEDFEPHYPDPDNARPLVVHTSSHLGVKGTPAVLAAVEQLKKTHSFEFKLLHNVSYAETRNMMQRCDILVDQIVLGDYANAASEGMAYGKPVICYVLPSAAKGYPPELPLVNANPDTIADALRTLLEDGRLRNDLGRRGRSYMEKHHDAHTLAKEMVDIYDDVLRRHRGQVMAAKQG